MRDRMEVTFVDDETGIMCRTVYWRSMGYFCGYAEVQSGHPWHGKPYQELDVDVHGGLTFGDLVEGEWWIGFDCAHGGDATSFSSRGVFRDEAYVRSECAKMARQIKASSPPKCKHCGRLQSVDSSGACKSCGAPA